MKLHHICFLLLLFITGSLLLQNCSLKEDIDKLSNPDWRPDVAIPLVNSTVSVMEIFDRFKDDSLIIQDGDGFVILIYKGRIYSNKGEIVFTIPNFPITSAQIDLPNLSANRSLGAVANTIGGPIQTTINSAHNGPPTNIPAIPNQSLGSFSITGNTQSSSFVFESGILYMTIENNYPFDITNLQINLVDSITSTIVAGYNFALIPAGETRTKSQNLTAGTTISKAMEISIPSFSSNAASNVLVDTTSQMVITFDGENLVFEAFRDTIGLNLTNGEDLNTLRLKEGEIFYSGSSTLNSNTQISVEFANGTGTPIQFGVNSTGSEDLSGYEFDFSTPGLPKNAIVALLKVDASGVTIPLTSGLSITPNLSIDNILIGYVDGYLGNQEFNLAKDTIDISIFANLFTGGAKFLNPQIALIISNSYGMPITSKFNTFLAYSERLNDTLKIVTPFDSIKFNYPTMAQIGQFAKTITWMNKDNSNMLDVMDMPASEIRYGLNVQSNTEKDTSIMNFILDTSYFKVDVEIHLPLEGRITSLVLRDTFNMEGGALENADYINFAVVTENDFPFDLDLQVYFIDENNDSLTQMYAKPEQIFVSGNINANGRVVSPTKKIIYTEVKGAKYELVKKTSKIVLEGEFVTTNNGATTVKIFSDNYFTLKIGAEAKFHPRF